MPTEITQTITAYKFNELSEKAKQKVREWYCENIMIDDWYYSVYEGAKMDGAERGFEIEDIRFSGFWSQGDGASWTGSVHLPKFLEWLCTQDAYEPLHHRIVPFIELMKDGWVEQRVAVNRTGYHYVHENTVKPDSIDYESLDLEMGDGEGYGEAWLHSEGVLKGASVAGVAEGIDARTLVEQLDGCVQEEVKDFCQEIYERLEQEYDWLTEDEQIAEACEANEWVFDEDGRMV